MNRSFCEIREGKIADFSDFMFIQHLSSVRNLGWEDLLKSQRILIVSEAGSGKTYECRKICDQLWNAGEAAFFLELAQLDQSGVSEMLSPEEGERFNYWLKTQSETATFFLDSYDELKLTLGSFEQALKRVARALNGHLGRCRIIMTSRPIPIDIDLFQRHLPIPQATHDRATAGEFADIVMRGGKQTEDKKVLPPSWRFLALLPLSVEQIREMAHLQKVADVDALLEDITRSNAEEFAQRPQDLIELCAAWNDHLRIGTHKEQVESNIAIKLAARIDRNEKVELSLEDAKNGASRLALASVLTRKLTLRHSVNADSQTTSQPALDPTKILPDWTNSQRVTLLERPLFGFATYGRVRFHHRSVIEFLAARRLQTLLDLGMSMKSIKRILFTVTPQGIEIVKPSMRPIAAWLALNNDSIFEDILRREPAVLLNYGDPESLRSSQKAVVLRKFVETYGPGGWRGLHIPYIQIHRFASLELTEEIRSLWHKGIENPDVREMILQIIEAACIKECGDIAYVAATNKTASQGEMIHAISALAAIRDTRLSSLTSSMVDRDNAWPADIIRWAAIKLFPENLSVDLLCSMMGIVQEKRYSAGQIGWHLPKIIEGANISNDEVDKLSVGLADLIKDNLSLSDGHSINSPRAFLIPALAASCIRQIQRGELSASGANSCILALCIRHDGYGNDDPSKRLNELIKVLSGPERKRLFLAHDDFIERLRHEADSWKRYVNTRFYGPLALNEEQDIQWVHSLIKDSSVHLELRAVMLQAALQISHWSVDQSANLSNLKEMAGDLPGLADIFVERSNLLNSPRDPFLEKLRKDNAKAQVREERKLEKARESWMKFWSEVANHPEKVFDEEHAAETTWNLWRAMERSGQNSRASGWSRRFIEENFGVQTADRLRTALMQTWRKKVPTLRSERKEDEREHYSNQWQLGLAGIYAEAEDPGWAINISHEDAQLAARYVPLEMNGFPPWLESLIFSQASDVDRVLGEELTAELNEAANIVRYSPMLQSLDYAAEVVAVLFVPRLEQWLIHNWELTDTEIDDDGALAHRLLRVVQILLKHGTNDTKKKLLNLAIQNVSDGATKKADRIWLPLLMQLDSVVGVTAFERTLHKLPVESQGAAVGWFALLFGDRQQDFPINLSASGFTPELLLRLVRLSYQHIRPIDDPIHEGSYSPDLRDHAERGRNAILSALLDATGAEGWAAKIAMTEDPLFTHFKDRVASMAVERAAQECDLAVFKEDDVVKLDSLSELASMTADDMFTLLVDRLDDIDDLLLRDVSPRAAWQLIRQESAMRQVLAHVLHNDSRGAYTVDQEAATADNKETDIRLRSTCSGQQAVIELKIGEKGRSAAELRNAIKDQLVKKYMADTMSKSGCFLVSDATGCTWRDPDTAEILDLNGLIAMLNIEAKKIQDEYGGMLRLVAKGLSLQPRLLAERVTRRK